MGRLNLYSCYKTWPCFGQTHLAHLVYVPRPWLGYLERPVPLVDSGRRARVHAKLLPQWVPGNSEKRQSGIFFLSERLECPEPW